MWEETGQQNMPEFSKFKRKQVTKLFRLREIGLTSNLIQSCYRRATENSYSDLHFARSLLCDEQAYLETIACRQIVRSKAPAFCQGRLFTEKYQAWFNLYTGPTSGPLIMTSDLFGSMNSHSSSSGAISEVKVVEVVYIVPPLYCTSLPHRKLIGPRLVLLSKSGWLYEADLETCDIVSKTYIPTKKYATDICDQDLISKRSRTVESFEEPPTFSYRYVQCNKESESIVIKSARVHNVAKQTSSFAFCLFHLYPLRFRCHFILSVISPNQSSPFTPEIVDDMFILNATRGSKINFYNLQDVIDEHDLGVDLNLHQKVHVATPNGLQLSKVAFVGCKELGIPYSMKAMVLNGSNINFKSPCLFKTAAMRHCLQIGGCPYHYLVPTNKSGTSWVIKHIDDHSEVVSGKIQVEKRWDSSHWQSICFQDESVRIVKKGLSSFEMFSLRHELLPNYDSLDISNKKRYRCRLVRDYVIDLQPVLRSNLTSANFIPPLPPYAMTSYGRLIRRPRFWAVAQTVDSLCPPEEEGLLVNVEYDQELCLLIIVHYRPVGYFSSGWEQEEGRAELVVSLFDSYFGKYLRSFVLESNTSPSDRDTVGVTLIDHNTFIYTRLRPNDDRIQYKILRLNRKYGDALF